MMYLFHISIQDRRTWPGRICPQLHPCLFYCSGKIPRLSLIRHSLYVGLVEKSPPPPLTGEQYGKMEPKQGSLTSPFMCSKGQDMYQLGILLLKMQRKNTLPKIWHHNAMAGKDYKQGYTKHSQNRQGSKVSTKHQ